MADEKSEKPAGKGLVIILAVVIVILLIAVGFGAYLLVARSGAEESAQMNPPEVAEQKEATPEVALGPLVELEEFIVNLMDEQDTRYLKAALTLELSNQDVVSEVEQRNAQIRDAILLLIGSKTYDELRDLQGKLQLRAELAQQINDFLQKGEIAKIYFTDFVVQ